MNDYSWFNDMPGIFKAVIVALCIMLILIFIISGIYYLPKKNREMKSELLQIERDIAKKKVVLTNQLKEYVDLVDRTTKEKAKLSEAIAALDKQKSDLESELEKQNTLIEKLKKQVGGRPKKTDK